MNNYIAAKNSTLYHMRWLVTFMLITLAASAFCSDSVYTTQSLKGYKKLFYKLITIHPAVNSPIEQKLLQHYLAGSGTTYMLTDSEFQLLKKTVAQQNLKDTSTEQASPDYVIKRISLDHDAYFGFALGTITCIYDKTKTEMISFLDVYDFNKKRKGIRKLKSEIATRIFRLIEPRSSKKFIVSYGDAAYFIQNQ